MRCSSTATFSSELRHKYNVRSILIRKDDEVQVDCNLLFGATPQIQHVLHPHPQGLRSAGRLGHLPQIYRFPITDLVYCLVDI